MNFDAKIKLGQTFYERKQRGATNAQLSNEYHIDERRIREFTALYRAANDIESEAHNAPQPIRQSLSYEQTIGKQNQAAWADTIRNWHKQRSVVKVAFPTDIHFPFQDTRACNLFLKIAETFEPDVIIDGSDVFDHPNLSKHYTGIKAKSLDVWNTSKGMYGQWRKAITKRMPNAQSVFLPGNHDHRMITWSRDEAPQVAVTLEKEFVNTIVDSGSLWLGKDYDMLQIGSLLVVHGDKTGKNAAENTWRHVGFPHRATIAGHIHSMQHYDRTTVVVDKNGSDAWHMTTVDISGCLCDIRPSWNEKRSGFSWNLGFILATVDMQNDSAYIERVLINPANYTTQWGGKLWT